ncbi:IclR family transcriptional regulator [Halegenticoccus soli]|uniref:IclR family transcriptional regulator n=1 Tax=Halegenticoccus soli TaxID=1985678 RepID=UPI000C6D59E3|nr:IclR family transcriptional regulator [Halegenticoccus soli]
MQGENTRRGQLKSVRRAFEIAERIRELEGVSVSALADDMNVAKSTLHAYLATLNEMGYLIKEGDEYQVGTRFLLLGEYSRTRKEEYRMAAEKVEELAEKTDERSQFVIEERGRGVFLYRAFGNHAVETGSETGKRMFLHSTAAGKSILAHLPESRVREIIEERGLPAVTPNSITDEEELFAELEQIREQGYAYNEAENIEGLHAIGVPVRGKNKEVIGALSVSGPTHRMKGNVFVKELPDLLLGTANELELNIAYL